MKKAIKNYGITFLLIALIVGVSVYTAQAGTSDYASSYGANYFDGVDTRSGAQSIRNNLNSAGYNCTYYENYPSSIALNYMVIDRVFSFRGHSSYDGQALAFYSKNSNGNYVYSYIFASDINTKSLSYMKLACFFGCKTARPASSVNLLDAAVNRGAKCAIGMYDPVYTAQMNTWSSHFTYQLSKGKSILESRYAADDYVKSQYGSNLGGTDSHRSRGDNTQILKIN